MGLALQKEVGIGSVNAEGPLWTGYGSVPCNTKTMVLLRLFLDPSRTVGVQSRYSNTQQQSPNTQQNIVEVAFYDTLGRPLQSNEQNEQHPTFYYVRCVSEWLVKFSPSTKSLFSQLKPPQNVANRPYNFY